MIQPSIDLLASPAANFASNHYNPSLLELQAFGPPIFGRFKVFSVGNICADPTCVEALAPICVLHHQQFAGSNSLWIKLPARSAGFDLTVAYFSTSDRKSSCPALLRAIQCGLDFVQTNFCAQISALGVVSGCSLQLRIHTTHLGIETLHSCVAGIVSRLAPCG